MKLENVTSILIFLYAVALLSGTEWRIPVRFNPTSLDTYYHYTYYFGEHEGATDDYDPFIDLAIPIEPPEGFFPYFVGDTVGDTIMPYLREDYRADVDTGIGHIDYVWQLSFRDDPGESTFVIWDADSFPYTPEYPLYMHFIVSETIPDNIDWLTSTPITEQETIFVSLEQSVFFKYWDRTGIREFQRVPEKIMLSAYPNPFNSSCKITISYSADIAGNSVSTGNAPISSGFRKKQCEEKSRRAQMTLKVYDLRGNVVGATRWVAQENGDATHRPYIWHPNETISSGLYFVRATLNDGRTITKRIIYLK